MVEIMLVDGYNVINAWPELTVLTDNLAFARDKLVDILVSYGAYKDYRVIVVFDAHSTAGEDTLFEVVPGKLEVVYTREGETADSYIEKAAYRIVRQGCGVYVVTSDWAEQLTILGAGAWRIPVRELRLEVLAVQAQLEAGYGDALTKRRLEVAERLNQDTLKRLNELRRGR